MFLYYVAYRYQFLYVCQSKIDTKGECYKRALKQMMTGVYLAEICLLGLLSARKALGPTVLVVVLLILTAVVNLVVDRMLKPLELYLGVDHWQEEEVPLLAQEEGISEDDADALHIAAHNRRLGLQILPGSLPDILSAFFDSFISASKSQMTSWLHDPAAREGDELPSLPDDEMDKAYLNPALTSKTPKLWLVKDDAGVSKLEIEENEKAGIPSTDDAATLDAKGRVQWEKEDFSRVPIFKAPVRY